MQPSEALTTSAQIAVTLAGFAGVVVAFRNRSVHEWSRIDKFRLQILLTVSHSFRQENLAVENLSHSYRKVGNAEYVRLKQHET